MPRIVLKVVDRIFSLLVVCPLVVLYWRGLWYLTDIYVLPGCLLLSGLVTWLGGLAVTFSLTAVQSLLHKLSVRQPGYVQVTSRLQQLCFGAASVSAWRGFWLLEDLYFGISMESSMITFAVALVVLLLLRSMRSAADCTPLVIAMDEAEDCFVIPTRFQKKPHDSILLFLGDCFISVFVVGTLTISVWRGLWSFLDQVELPLDILSSATASLAIGYLASIGLFIAEPTIIKIHRIFRAWSSRRKRLWLLMLEDFWSFCSIFAAVASWRALWMVADIYLVRDLPWTVGSTLASGWALSLLCCSPTIAGAGVAVDGLSPEEGGPTLPFRIAYFTAMSKEEQRVLQNDAEGGTFIN